MGKVEGRSVLIAVAAHCISRQLALGAKIYGC